MKRPARAFRIGRLTTQVSPLATSDLQIWSNEQLLDTGRRSGPDHDVCSLRAQAAKRPRPITGQNPFYSVPIHQLLSPHAVLPYPRMLNPR